MNESRLKCNRTGYLINLQETLLESLTQWTESSAWLTKDDDATLLLQLQDFSKADMTGMRGQRSTRAFSMRSELNILDEWVPPSVLKMDASSDSFRVVWKQVLFSRCLILRSRGECGSELYRKLVCHLCSLARLSSHPQSALHYANLLSESSHSCVKSARVIEGSHAPSTVNNLTYFKLDKLLQVAKVYWDMGENSIALEMTQGLLHEASGLQQSATVAELWFMRATWSNAHRSEPFSEILEMFKKSLTLSCSTSTAAPTTTSATFETLPRHRLFWELGRIADQRYGELATSSTLSSFSRLVERHHRNLKSLKSVNAASTHIRTLERQLQLDEKELKVHTEQRDTCLTLAMDSYLNCICSGGGDEYPQLIYRMLDLWFTHPHAMSQLILNRLTNNHETHHSRLSSSSCHIMPSSSFPYHVLVPLMHQVTRAILFYFV